MFNLPLTANEIANLYQFARRATEAAEREADALERIAAALEVQNEEFFGQEVG